MIPRFRFALVSIEIQCYIHALLEDRMASTVHEMGKWKMHLIHLPCSLCFPTHANFCQTTNMTDIEKYKE